MAVPSVQCKNKRNKKYIALCSPTVEWEPLYWWTRHPQDLGTENVANPDLYLVAFTFVTIFVAFVCLKLLTYVGEQFGLPTTLQDVPFFPFP